MRTVSSQIRSRRAIWAFDSPAAAASTKIGPASPAVAQCARPGSSGSVARCCAPVNVIRSVPVGDILALHDEFGLATPAFSPVTGWMVVTDTPIRQDR